MASIRRALSGILILLLTNAIVENLATVTSGEYRIECVERD